MPYFYFFFNDTATTEIYTLSLHDALPILSPRTEKRWVAWAASTSTPGASTRRAQARKSTSRGRLPRSEEHTSELQSLAYLVCRLLLEKKKKKNAKDTTLKQLADASSTTRV